MKINQNIYNKYIINLLINQKTIYIANRIEFQQFKIYDEDIKNNNLNQQQKHKQINTLHFYISLIIKIIQLKIYKISIQQFISNTISSKLINQLLSKLSIS
ncbi:hypothetical protein ABPG74_020323 [Tetrahymena malaccensis]